jgi:Protein of unknown function (DUF2380)
MSDAATWAERPRGLQAGVRLAAAGVLAFAVACLPVSAADPAKPPVIKIAVFNFELDDASPAASLMNQATSAAASMQKVSDAARQELALSGKYSVIDAGKIDMSAVPNKSFRDCDGCEAGIALKLGADQALIGVLNRATQTDYYLWVQIRDARTGKIIDQQAANFAGGEEGWASGLRMLIKHQILVTQD